MVSVLTFYNNLSLNPTVYSVKFVLEKNENEEKRSPKY